MQPVEDPALAGATVADLLALPAHDNVCHFFVADATALADPEHPVLVVNRTSDCSAPGRSFRVVAAWAWAPQNNLAVSNMHFHEFADCADAHGGLYRGS